MNIEKYQAMARESEIWLFKHMAGWSVGLLVVGLGLFEANTISAIFLQVLVGGSAVLFVTSFTGHIMLAGQKDNKPLSYPRWLVVEAAALLIPLGGLYIYGSISENVSVIQEMDVRQWPDDINIEPDGVPSEEGVFH